MIRSQHLCIILTLLVHGPSLLGQTYTESNASGPLSPSLALAAANTTYALGGLDRVNYYNGNLSVRIPLTTVGGRGNATVAMSVPVNRQWRVQQVYTNGVVSYVPTTAGLGYVGVNYTPGYLTRSASSANPDSCIVDDQNGQHWAGLGPYLTWLVWHGADGSETVLVDTAYNGQAQSASITSCLQLNTYQPANRGRTFKAYDGSNLMFVASQDVLDTYLPGSNYAISGTLYFPDGTHYIIDSAFITGVVDRNGNRITYAFQLTSSGGTYTISDSAGRTETITFTEDPANTHQDIITYPGNGGQIIVNYDQLQNVLNSGEALKTSKCLFPELDGSATTQFNPWVISSIVLADQSSYTFKYNSYGELARLGLPTGGAYTYQYPAAASCNDTSGASGVISVNQGAQYSIYRRLVERDELANGSTVSARTVFTATAVPASPSPIDPNHPTRSGTKVQVDFEDLSTNLLRRETHYFYGDPSSPSSLPVPDTSYPNWTDGIEFKTEIGAASSTLQVQQRLWRQRPCGGSENCWFGDPQADSSRPHDPQVCQANTQLDSTQASYASGLVFGYDQFSNSTDVYEFDYGSAPSIGASCPTLPIANGYARHTVAAYKDDSGYLAVNLVRLPISRTVYNDSGGQASQESWIYDGSALQSASGLAGHDDVNYGTGNTVRGNVTAHQVWQSSTGTSPSESYTYDTTGSVVGYSDFNSNVTSFTYGDGAHVSPTQVTNALSQTQQFTYDQSILKPIQSTDANNVTTSYSYTDPLDRLTAIKRAVSSAAETWTRFSYPTTTSISVIQDQNTKSDGAIRLDTVFDGLGRQVEARQYEGASQYISSTTSYDALGRVYTTTNPSRSGDGLNFTTTYGYDALGRPSSVLTSDGATTTFSYSFDQTAMRDQAEVTDPAGNKRRRMTDALSRLTQVVEDPSGLNNSTTYAHDALDNLKTVTQGGQTRTFNYDSRSRLTVLTTPEGGTINFTSYDNNGNLTQRTSGGVTTTYTYDALNRVTLISYTGISTPAVTYCYDGKVFGSSDGNCVAGSATNAAGRLTQVRTSVSTTSYTGYDPLGRVTASIQKTFGVEYPAFQYAYDLSGALTKETYPSGRTVMNGYDAAGRLCSVGGTTASPPPAPPYTCSGSGTTVYASSIQYAPQGALKSLARGDQLTETWSYNSRMQPSGVTVGSAFGLNLYYCTGKAASCSTNNGSLLTVTPATPGVDQVAGYDHASRLASFQEGSNSQNYGYDPPGNGWANRWVSLNSGLLPLSTFMPTTSSGYNALNQLTAGQYSDGRGNMTGLGGYGFTYDGENRLVTVQIGQATITYGYDGVGQRATKTSGGQTTTYVYDAMGNLAAEYGTSTAPCTTCYVSVDQLGSTRVLTDAQGNVKERHDYAPSGDELLAGIGGRTTAQGYLNPDTQPGVNVLFTGQYRDWELGSSGMASGLDYFRARHHAPALGRFMQPDPVNIGAVGAYPQTWHAYNYVANNPLMNTDPFGLFCPAGGCVAPPPSPPPPPPSSIDRCWLFPSLCWAPGRGEQAEATPPPLPPKSQPVTVPANNVRIITVAPPKPLATKSRKATAGCISARLIHNFIGDDDTTAVTLTVNIAAGLALRKIGTKAAASLLPGPGWLYVGAATLYDIGMVGETYFYCANGATEGGANPEGQDD
ncbi:MAG TPA: RHS repeat-associated core domain-containing protein [Bryobacteraceae bacterium]|nr:RHS repeat-associated core domain-containing protein [Bryobacteraceae bacterium]